MTDSTTPTEAESLATRLDMINVNYDLAAGIHANVRQASALLRTQEAEINTLRTSFDDDQELIVHLSKRLGIRGHEVIAAEARALSAEQALLEARGALEPFAEIAQHNLGVPFSDDHQTELRDVHGLIAKLPVSVFRRARSALAHDVGRGSSDSGSPTLLRGSHTPNDGWQDIATAPKDGTIIDLWFAGGGMDPKNVHACRQVGRWRKADQYDDAGWTAGVFVPDPAKYVATHWMPLPAAPTLSSQADGSGQ